MTEVTKPGWFLREKSAIPDPLPFPKALQERPMQDFYVPQSPSSWNIRLSLDLATWSFNPFLLLHSIDGETGAQSSDVQKQISVMSNDIKTHNKHTQLCCSSFKAETIYTTMGRIVF